MLRPFRSQVYQGKINNIKGIGFQLVAVIGRRFKALEKCTGETPGNSVDSF